MDCQSLVIVRGDGGRFLFVETKSRKLQLGGCMLRKGEDFQAAAVRCLKEVSRSAMIPCNFFFIDLPILHSTVIYGTIYTRISYAGAVCQW